MQNHSGRSEFHGLPAATNSQPSRSLRLCIASCEFIGPIRNGGIGTAYTAMAHALVAAGHDVTLLYTQGQRCENETIAHWQSHYRSQGLRFVARPSDPALRIDAPDHALRSYETYLWLKNQDFDVVHFPEWGGDAYYSVLAKHQGIAFHQTLFCVGTHSPTSWLKEANSDYYTHLSDLELDFMERQAVKLADVVVSPCQYMLNWMRDHGFELPARSHVQQNILPRTAMADEASGRLGGTGCVSEIVFFGRLETRKGIELFCDALDRLASQKLFPDVRISFMGKPATVSGSDSRAYIKTRARKWKWKWEIVSNLDQPGAMRYLKQAGRLAVIPSLMENSPYTVLECLGGGIPFLASRVGGIPELIISEDLPFATFEPKPPQLSALLERSLREGVRPWRPAVEPAANQAAWARWHEGLLTGTRASQASIQTVASFPMVTVCVAHFNRPKLLSQALDSLEAQDYSNFEVIVVDDGSSDPEALAYLEALEPRLQRLNWRLVRQENRYLSAARNTGARHARGEYLVFMDDDNFARPDELSKLVAVATHTGAEIVTCCMDYFDGTQPPDPRKRPTTRWVPLGAAASAGFYRNCFGDANFLIKREAFKRLGGFTEIHGVTHEDWEFLANAAIKGCHLEIIPEPLFYYRYSKNSMIRSTSQFRNHMRHIQAYLNAVPKELHQVLLLAQGAHIHGTNGLATNAVAQLALKWRSQYEAGCMLRKMGHDKAATESLLNALKSAEATDHPVTVFEALLEVGRELRSLDRSRSRQVLQLAVQLGETLKLAEPVQLARNLLAELTGSREEEKGTPLPVPTPKPATPAPQPPEASIVIPVFNNLDLTRACLDSIESHTSGVPYEIIVVDNASTDGTREWLARQEAQGRLRVITNAGNEGFARACNQGAQLAVSIRVVFLNNDTEVTSGWLNALVNASTQDSVGVVGAKLLYADRRVQHAGVEFINGIPDHPHRYANADAPEVNRTRDLDMVTGACLLIQRALFMELGGFDEVYKNGVEDVDLCLRARLAGYRVVYEPRAVVYHLEGQSAGRFDHVRQNLEIFFTRFKGCFDASFRLICRAEAELRVAEKSFLVAKEDRVPNPHASVRVAWEGSFLDYGSLSHVNREFTVALAKRPGICLSRVGSRVLTNGYTARPELQALLKDMVESPSSRNDVTVRHAWPPNWTPSRDGALVIIQPWEYGSLPAEWVSKSSSVREFWVPSEHVRQVYISSGIPAAKVHVVPNGIDPAKFHPATKPLALATKKKFKFLFVGGTIFRKGPDVLLHAFLNTFTAADDVCLVIKDFGNKSCYAGQTLEATIQAAQAKPDAPEVLYLDSELAPDEIPGLYTACDCFVHPFRGEGFGLPILEAMACGIPVITSAGGAADDFATEDFAYKIPTIKKSLGSVVSGMKLSGTGWLLEPNVQALAQTMQWVKAHPEEAKERGRKASEHVRTEWTWDKAAAKAHARMSALLDSSNNRAEASAGTRSPKRIQAPACARLGQLQSAHELFKQKKLSEAWQATRAAIEARPHHPEAYLLLAQIAQAAGDSVSARLCGQHARMLAPSWKPAKKFLKGSLHGRNHPDWLVLPACVGAGESKQQPKISVCLIVRNEERFLGQCLNSVKGLANQIVVVDTGSTDRTKEIALEGGAEVHDFLWCEDFSAARNEALRHATGDWVLMLDADEEMVSSGSDALLRLARNKDVIAWRLPLFDAGREDEGCNYVPRFFRNAPGLFYVGRIHEQVFSSIEVRRAEWGLENRLGDATIRHHGYTAELLKDRNKIERNLRLLELALEDMPDESHLIMNYGLELVRSGRVEEGLQQYQRAFDVMSRLPQDLVVPEARETLLAQYCTQLTAAARYTDIVAVLESPLARGGKGLSAGLHFTLGLALMKLSRFEDCAREMRQCISKRHEPALIPQNKEIQRAGPRHCLAVALVNAKQIGEAGKVFQEALAEDPASFVLRLDYAKFLAQNTQPVEALQLLHALAQERPEDASVWVLGGQIALSHPEFLEVACDWTEEALTRHQENPQLRSQRAEALLFASRPDRALELIRSLPAGAQNSNLACLILCQHAVGQEAPAVPAEVEPMVSGEFIKWYQRLVRHGAAELVLRLNANLAGLRQSLPSAARLLESAIAEADHAHGQEST